MFYDQMCQHVLYASVADDDNDAGTGTFADDVDDGDDVSLLLHCQVLL